MVKNLQFYNFLVAGASAKNVAKVFAIEMMSKTILADSNWRYEVGCTFIKQSFQAVGLKCSLTVENLRNQEYDRWRQENLSYVFAYDATKLHLVDEFLSELGSFVDELEQDQNLEESAKNSWNSALVNYSAVVYNWLNVATQICSEESFNGITDKYFREPIALLSFFLLKSIAPLEHKYKGTYPMLKQYSSILSWVMSYGLLYRRTHKDILNGMLELISNYHDVFIVYESKQWIFFQLVLICDLNNTSSIQLLGFLTIMMLKWSAPEMIETSCPFYLRELTNILMKKKMLNTYNNILTTAKSKRILIAILSFLDVLQSKLISTEGFTKNFLNGVLLLVLEHQAAAVRKKAAELYSQIVRPQTEYNILLHILSVYTSAMTMNTKYFSDCSIFHTYIYELSAVFPMMNLLGSYLGIINNKKVQICVRKVAAKAILYIFSQNQHKADPLTVQGVDILDFVVNLPFICVQNYDVLVPMVADIYYQFDCQYFAEKIGNSNEILSNLEDFGMELIVNDKLDTTDLEAIIISLVKFAKITNNTGKIIAFCTEVNSEFKQQEKYLTKAQAQSKEPTTALLYNYYSTLGCLNALTQNQVIFGIDLIYILSCLVDRFYPECMYDKVIEKTKINLYHVAYPLTCNIIILLSRDDYELGEYVSIIEATLNKLLVASNPNDYILCGELFKSLVLMYIEFASHRSSPLKLSATNYNILLGSLKLQLSGTLNNNSKRTSVKGMLEAFKYLIKNSAIVLPNSTIWKLLMHYKLNNHIFNDGLKSIIELFLKKRTRNYARAMPVIIYKLHMLTPSSYRIQRAITSHLELINATLSPLCAWCLKQHCFLSTLEIMNKATKLTLENNKQNRLLSLRNLLLVIKGMRLRRQDFHLINAVVRELKVPTLSTVEKKTLLIFRNELARYKDLCLHEKELAEMQPMPSHGKFRTLPIPTKAKIPWRLYETSFIKVSIENNEIIFNDGVDSIEDEINDSEDIQSYLEYVNASEQSNRDSDENNEDDDMEEEIGTEELVI